MTTVNLACREGHTFEAWFRSKAEFARQHAAGLVACPWCGEREIERRPSVPNLMRSHKGSSNGSRIASRGDGERVDRSVSASGSDWFPSASMQSFANTLRAFHRYIEHTCDDVGERFAVEARKMHEEKEQDEQCRQEQAEKRAEAEAEMLARSQGGGERGGDEKGRRGIYGQATAEELHALEEDGISVSPLPPLPSRHH